MLPHEKPLLGVPVSIKDTFAVKGFHHAVGIVARKDVIAEEDADVVKNIKAAGAIIIAITNVPEAAVWVESVNEVYGRTKNAYDPRRAAGGSSGGEGALIGAAGSLIGIGSDLAGSVRIPAQFNGIFGLKPSEFAISIKGHHPCFTKGYPTKMGNVGPLCRYAKDLPLFFRVLAGNEIAENRFQLSKAAKMENTRFFYMEGLRSCFIEPLQNEMKTAMLNCVDFFENKYNTNATQVDFAKLHHALAIYLTSLSETKDAPFAHLIKNMEGEVSVSAEFWKKLCGNSHHTLPTLMILLMDDFPPMDKKTREYVSY
uniref:Amidase domain-containing protein n=1 Tax=Panagrolaimus davidi TaxID=227884 RepID=A0A914QKK8_9BILA